VVASALFSGLIEWTRAAGSIGGFTRMVFRGGTLELIESVCVASADIGMPVPDVLRELVVHSLLLYGVRAPRPSAARTRPRRRLSR
jgi:hypothetical protein